LDLIRQPRIHDDRRGQSYVERGRVAKPRGILTETVRISATPIDTRVAIQTESVLAAAHVFNEHKPDRTVIINDVPRYREILEQGVGAFLQAAP